MNKRTFKQEIAKKFPSVQIKLYSILYCLIPILEESITLGFGI